jgi:hypothetical protein
VIVGGHPNKRTQPPIERIHKAYRASCTQFADDLGWDANTVADLFEQLHFMRIFVGWPRDLAAWQAMRDVRTSLWKPGETGN